MLARGVLEVDLQHSENEDLYKTETNSSMSFCKRERDREIIMAPVQRSLSAESLPRDRFLEFHIKYTGPQLYMFRV